jgi:hypothetical protein
VITLSVPTTSRRQRCWGRGGRNYDEVSFAISDALAHAAQRLNARDGERILDVATTGYYPLCAVFDGLPDEPSQILPAPRDININVDA